MAHEIKLRTGDEFLAANCCLKDEGVVIPHPSFCSVSDVLARHNEKVSRAFASYLIANSSFTISTTKPGKVGNFCCVLNTSSLFTIAEFDELVAIMRDYGKWALVVGDRTRVVFSPSGYYTEDERSQMYNEFLVNNGHICSVCGQFTVVQGTKRVCTQCGTGVGMHAHTDIAMGIPCTQSAREIRIQLHNVIDPIWKFISPEGGLSAEKARPIIYIEMASLLNKPFSYSHIAMQTKQETQITMRWATSLRKECEERGAGIVLSEMYKNQCKKFKATSL